jgi:hypothetical protein
MSHTFQRSLERFGFLGKEDENRVKREILKKLLPAMRNHSFKKTTEKYDATTEKT